MNHNIPNLSYFPEQISDLGVDQEYLYLIVKAFKDKRFPQINISLKPGSISNVRCLTEASHICRLFISQSKPDQTQPILTGNSYWASSENVLLSLVRRSEKPDPEYAKTSFRNSSLMTNNVRKFEMPNSVRNCLGS